MFALLCTIVPYAQGCVIQQIESSTFPVSEPDFIWVEIPGDLDPRHHCGAEVNGAWTVQPVSSPSATKWRCELVIQEELDKKAGEWGYTSSPGVGSMYSAATYLGSAVAKYRTEAETLVAWRDSVWEWAEAVLAEFDSPEFVPGFNEAEFRAMVPAAPARPIP
jgi:hypothetical protein